MNQRGGILLSVIDYPDVMVKLSRPSSWGALCHMEGIQTLAWWFRNRRDAFSKQISSKRRRTKGICDPEHRI